MKTNFSLRIFVAAGFCLFLGLSAFAQPMDPLLIVNQTVDQYVTVNKAMPFHVTPDAYFNPNYNAGGSWVVSSSFTWSVAPATGSFTSTSVINPDVTFSATVDHTLSVFETNADGCIDATPMTILVHVLAVPTFDFGARLDVQNCGDLAATNVLFDIAVNTADDYMVDWTYTVQNMLADKVTPDGAVITTTPHVDAAFAASGAGLVLANQAFPIVGGKVTRYTFTLNGINDAVSRVSDYCVAPRGVKDATNWTNYPAGADNTFAVVVLPAPTTGPIYHIPNL